MGINYITTAIEKFISEGMSRTEAIILMKDITTRRLRGAEFNERLYEQLLDDLDSIEEMLKGGM